MLRVVHILTQLVLFTFLISKMAVANTLSEAYYQVFADPHNFDSYLNDQIVLEENYYSKFNECFNLATVRLHAMERQENQNYSTCPNNAACTQIAKDIQSIRSMQTNVRNLADFIIATRSNPQIRVQNSQIGQAAIQVYNFHRNSGIRASRNPELRRQVLTLSAIPCQ